MMFRFQVTESQEHYHVSRDSLQARGMRLPVIKSMLRVPYDCVCVCDVADRMKH